MKAGDWAILGGVGLVAYLIYQTASSAADVGTNLFSSGTTLFSSLSNAAQSAIDAVGTGLAPVTTAIETAGQTVQAAPSMWNCVDSAAAAAMPFGTGALTVPDSYVVPCMGGVTAGMIRASGASNAELIQDIAAAECACAKAQMPGSGAAVQNNLIVPSSPGGVSGLGRLRHGLRHGYYARSIGAWPPGQFPRGHGI